MEIKTYPPVNVLYSQHQTTIAGLNALVGTIARQLYAEAADAGVLVSGAQQWVYYGMDGKSDTLFTLEIALPVQGTITSSRFGIKELPAFKALTHQHTGPWEKMPQTYAAMLQYIDQYKIALTDQCREIYLNVDFDRPDHNRVDIWMGIV